MAIVNMYLVSSRHILGDDKLHAILDMIRVAATDRKKEHIFLQQQQNVENW